MWIEGGKTGPVKRSHYRGQCSLSQARLRPADWRMGKVSRVEQVTGWRSIFTHVRWECLLQTSSGGIARERGSQTRARGNEAGTLPLGHYARGQQSPPRGGSTSFERGETKVRPIGSKLGRSSVHTRFSRTSAVWGPSGRIVENWRPIIRGRVSSIRSQ